MKDYKVAWGTKPEIGTCDTCKETFKYNISRKSPPIVCNEHKSAQSYVKNKLVECVCECSTPHTYRCAPHMGRMPKRCAEHRSSNPKNKVGDIVELTCTYDGKEHTFFYIFRTGSNPKFCAEHRSMIDLDKSRDRHQSSIKNYPINDGERIISRTCHTCRETFSYNDTITIRLEYCFFHRLDGYQHLTPGTKIDIICKYGFDHTFSYVYRVGKIRRYCEDHKSKQSLGHKIGKVIEKMCEHYLGEHTYTTTYTGEHMPKVCPTHRDEYQYKKPGPMTSDELSRYNEVRDSLLSIRSTFDSRKKAVRRERGSNSRKI